MTGAQPPPADKDCSRSYLSPRGGSSLSFELYEALFGRLTVMFGVLVGFGVDVGGNVWPLLDRENYSDAGSCTCFASFFCEIQRSPFENALSRVPGNESYPNIFVVSVEQCVVEVKAG